MCVCVCVCVDTLYVCVERVCRGYACVETYVSQGTYPGSKVESVLCTVLTQVRRVLIVLYCTALYCTYHSSYADIVTNHINGVEPIKYICHSRSDLGTGDWGLKGRC
jgi:hypothetical protein